MEGKQLYKCKENCNLLKDCCHNTKNRVISELCICDNSLKNKLAKYLKCLMVLECLCMYVCCCCCDSDYVSKSILVELNNKCDTISHCCYDLKKHLSNDKYKYLNCDKILKYCKNCKSMKKNKKTMKKK